MKKWQSSYLVVFLVFFLCSPAHSQISAEISNKNYPFLQPGMATVSSAAFSSATPKNLLRIKSSNSLRQNIVSLKNKAHLQSVYWAGRKGSPTVFVIPGIGGYSDFGSSGDVAKIFQSWGYHVVTFNNPFNWQFALTLSPDGAPGYFPEDAEILYKNMVFVKNELKTKYNINRSKVLLVTFSLGCQYTLDLLKIDGQKNEFNFSQVLMMNPPLDIAYALHKYDEINEIGSQKSGRSEFTNYETLRGRLIGVFEGLIGLEPAKAIKHYGQNYPLNDHESDIVIGGSFKDSLAEVIYITSLVHPDRHVMFKSPVSENRREARYAEIRQISFSKYFQNFVMRKMFVQSEFASNQELLASFSIKEKIHEFHADPRIKFILAENDPISRPKDVDLFATTFGNRALVLKRGGHAGFYWFPGFAADLKSFLKHD